MKFDAGNKNLPEFALQKELYARLRSKLGESGHIIDESGPPTVTAIRLPGGGVSPQAEAALALNAAQLAQLEQVGGGVARIDYRGATRLVGAGTAWLLGDRTVVTNRHVLEKITTFSGAAKFGQALRFVRVGFGGGATLTPVDYALDTTYDIGLLFFRDPVSINSLVLSSTNPVVSDRVFTIGFPGLDALIPTDQRGAFERIFPGPRMAKRFAAGRVLGVQGDIISHSVPGSFGSSGSPLLNDDFEVNGLHFGGKLGVSNFAISRNLLEARVSSLLA